MLEYETVNPNQDASNPVGDHFDPDEHTNNPRVSLAPEDYLGEERMYVTPREYGAGRRPYIESPAPTHPNGQFAGLAEFGMHAEGIGIPPQSIAGDSDRTLASPICNQGHKSALKPRPLGSSPNGNGHRSLRNNTHANRGTNQGLPDDEEFYGMQGA